MVSDHPPNLLKTQLTCFSNEKFGLLEDDMAGRLCRYAKEAFKEELSSKTILIEIRKETARLLNKKVFRSSTSICFLNEKKN